MNKTPTEIIDDLNNKFADNFAKWRGLSDPSLDRIFVGLYCISAVGEILSTKRTSTHHDICCKVFDEIFADIPRAALPIPVLRKARRTSASSGALAAMVGRP